MEEQRLWLILNQKSAPLRRLVAWSAARQ